MIAVLALSLGGCAGTVGVQPMGPDSFMVSEMRAPVLGGGAAAQRAAIGEAMAFCHYAGRVFVPVTMYPSGFAASPYGPTAYTAVFRCLPTNDPVVARLQADHAPWIESPPAHP
jgi:hypothetical protein